MTKRIPPKLLAFKAFGLGRLYYLFLGLLSCIAFIPSTGNAQSCSPGNNIGFGGVAATNTLTICAGATSPDTIWINNPDPALTPSNTAYFWEDSTVGSTFQITSPSTITRGFGLPKNSVYRTTPGVYYFRRYVFKSTACDGYSDIVTLVVVKAEANAGPALNTLCNGSPTPTLDGEVGGVATGGTWSAGGAGGSFSPAANNLAAIWTPAAGYTGTATLTLTSTGGMCAAATAFKKVSVVNGNVLRFSQPPDPVIDQDETIPVRVSMNICGTFNDDLDFEDTVTLKVFNGCGFTTQKVKAIAGSADFSVAFNRSPQSNVQLEASATGYASVLSDTFYVDGPGGVPNTVTIAQENFEGATTWGYSTTTDVTGTGGNGGVDNTGIKTFNGNKSLSKSFTSENGVGQEMSNTTITFNTQTGLTAYQDLKLRFQIASLYDPSGTPGPVGDAGGAGVDQGENMRIETCVDGAWFTSFKYTIGTENYLFSLSTKSQTRSYNANYPYTNPDDYSTYTIRIPDGTSTLAFRMFASNNRPSENWVIDNISLTGVLTSATLPKYPVEAVGGPVASCPNIGNTLSLFELNTRGAVTYSWSPVANLSNPTIANPMATVSADASYIGTITDEDGCQDTGRVNITVPGGTPGTWTGAENSDWFYCRNWSGGSVPSISTNVLLPNNAAEFVVIDPLSPYASLYGYQAKAKNLEVVRTLNLKENAELIVAGNLTILFPSTTVKGLIDMTDTSSHAGPNSIRLSGNWINNRGGAQIGFIPGKSTVSFISNTAQSIYAAATAGEKFYNLTVNKPSNSLTLQSNSLVAGTLTLTRGIVNTYISNPANTLGLLTLADTAAAVAGPPSTASFINGQLAKRFKTSGAASRYYLPIGKLSPTRYKYAAVEPTTISGTTTFTAEYFSVSPPTPSTVASAELLGYYGTQYWNIARSGGAKAKVILPHINAGGWVGGNDNTPMPGPGPSPQNNEVAIAHKNGTPWGLTALFADLDGAATPPEYRIYNNNGEISSAEVSNFSTPTFSVGYIYNGILPVKLLGFEGRLLGSDGSLSWKVASITDLAGFVLEYSTDGQRYKKLADIAATNGNAYGYVHKMLSAGNHYYRLLVREKTGSSYHSSVVLLTVGQLHTQLLGLTNTIIKNNVGVKILSVKKQPVSCRITDAAGKQVAVQKGQLQTGSNLWQIPTSWLSNGMYFISISTDDGVKGTLPFIKE